METKKRLAVLNVMYEIALRIINAVHNEESKFINKIGQKK